MGLGLFGKDGARRLHEKAGFVGMARKGGGGGTPKGNLLGSGNKQSWGKGSSNGREPKGRFEHGSSK